MQAASLDCVRSAALAALLQDDPEAKCVATAALPSAWAARTLVLRPLVRAPQRLACPGRPARPELVRPETLPRRHPGSRAGHGALLHAVAHIEFNAINLALDCVHRFGDTGPEFVTDWLRVAAEEAMHFGLLVERLAALDYRYGDFPAHNGLWEMALRTDSDLLARMALVPRVLEARGLDATPPIQAKLARIGDQASLAVLDVILRDEIGHVAVGDRWFRHVCAQRGLAPEPTYLALIDQYGAPRPRPPFNREARLAAGFSPAELNALETAADEP